MCGMSVAMAADKTVDIHIALTDNADRNRFTFSSVLATAE